MRRPLRTTAWSSAMTTVALPPSPDTGGIVGRRPSARALGALELAAEAGERRRRERALDEREQLALLEPHVRVEPLAERVQRLEVGGVRSRLRKAGGGAADLDVVEQDAHDLGAVDIGVLRVGGQQHLLLGAEVHAAVLGPERQEATGRLR